MTPKEQLVTADEDADFDEITSLLHEHRIEKVLLVNDKFELRGMVTVKDINKAKAYPISCKDSHGQLRVGASVGTSPDTDDRVAALVEAGVDVLVVDTAHGHSQKVLDRISWIKQRYPDMNVIGGNVATADGARALLVRRCRCGEGRDWSRFHLHDPGRHRNRRTADHGSLQAAAEVAAKEGCAGDCRRRRALLG